MDNGIKKDALSFTLFGFTLFNFSTVYSLSIILFTTCTTLCSVQIKASTYNQSLAVDYVNNGKNREGFKLAYQHHTRYFQSKWPQLESYVELSTNVFKFTSTYHEKKYSFMAISPVFSYPASYWNSNPIYVEAGIGLAILDEKKFVGQRTGANYLFENRLGLAYYFGKKNKYSITLRYFHYSNAGLRRPNPGFNFLGLSYQVKI